MSHYPSTAELAAFREDIHALRGPHHPDDCVDGMSHPDDYNASDASAAWPDELIYGIGYDFRTEGMGVEWEYDDAALCRIARRMAGEDRARAYRAMPCGSVAYVLAMSDIPQVTCERTAGHSGSHCAYLPGCWQWWNRDGSRSDVEIPMDAYVRGGKPSDWIAPR